MSKILKLTTYLLIFLFSFKNLLAADIPVIVIAPSKKVQSISTVGSTITVFDESYFENTNNFFLGDILGTNTTSYNFFQSGGYGAESAIQLRGLPKRYSTVYIDGVKMSDPSNVSNDYNFNHILKNQISRVEILKGNQSSVYGSGAIGGTINITTKKGKPGFQKNISYNTASHGTHNLALSLSGADENNDFYIGLERFQTDGVSAMDDNDESDRYRNNTIVANYGHKFSDKIKFESNLRFVDTFLQYDTTNQVYNDNNQSDATESSASVALVYKPIKKFTNRFTVASTYIDRIYNTYADDQDLYTGDRKALTYTGIYNFNLDNSVVFGSENEFDSMYMKKISDKRYGVNQGIVSTSNYIDFQSRVSKNLYATLGGFRHNAGIGQVGKQINVKSKVITIQGSETMDGMVNWEATQAGDSERFSQEVNSANRNKDLKSYDVYLKKKAIIATAKKAARKAKQADKQKAVNLNKKTSEKGLLAT
tara:strand:+ start:133 stop:1572 length:1440 start_codon:yes stop_codon:yes gene_type:complete